MNWHHLWNSGKDLVLRGYQQIEHQVKLWTKPAPDRQVSGIMLDLFPV